MIETKCVGMVGVGITMVVLSACGGGSGDGGDGDTSSDREGDGPRYENVECPEDQVPCNGECLPVGESAHGCSTLLRLEGFLHEIELDETSIYLAVAGDVFSVDKIVVYDKSTLALSYEIVLSEESTLGEIAVNDTHLAWVEWPPFSSDPILLYAAPKGSTTGELISSQDDLGGLQGLDGGWLLQSSSFNEDDNVVRIPTGGGDAVGVGRGSGYFDSTSIQVKNGAYYYSTGGGPDPELIWSQSLEGGDPAQITAVEAMYGFHVDDAHMYLIEGDTSSDPRHLSRVPLTGGETEPLGEDTHQLGSRLYGYGSWLYHTYGVTNEDETQTNHLLAHPKSGGEERIVASSSETFMDMAVDETGLYVSQSRGTEGFHLIRIDLVSD